MTRNALKAKQTCLKQMGKGNKPKACNPISDEDINILYDKGVLGPATPQSLLNTIWFNNCVHLGIRGTTECRNVR